MVSKFAGDGQPDSREKEPASHKPPISRKTCPLTCGKHEECRLRRNAYLREWRRSVSTGERVPRRTRHPSPWCRAGHVECRWLRSMWEAAKRHGEPVPVWEAEHPWRHSDCEPCRIRRNEYSRKWMRKNRVSERQPDRVREARSELVGGMLSERRGVVNVLRRPVSVCQVCGVPVLEHDLLRRCG